MKKYLTQQGLKDLKEKLLTQKKELQNIRKEKSEAWERDGDGPHDNPLYHKLKDDEELKITQINEIESLITQAVIVDPSSADSSKVSIGSTVKCKIKFYSNNKIIEKEFEICGYNQSDFKKSKIAYNSPIGSSLIDMKAGESKEVKLPNGKAFIEIENITYINSE